MLPLFYAVDHRIDPSPLPFEERRALRRSAPERLHFNLPGPGLPVLYCAASAAPRPMSKPIRVRVGLLLVAWGQRLAQASQAP